MSAFSDVFHFTGVFAIQIDDYIEVFSVFRSFVDLIAKPVNGSGERFLQLLRKTKEGKRLELSGIPLSFPLLIQIERNFGFETGVSNLTLVVCLSNHRAVCIDVPKHWCWAMSYAAQAGHTIEDALNGVSSISQGIERYVLHFRSGLRTHDSTDSVNVDVSKLCKREILFALI